MSGIADRIAGLGPAQRAPAQISHDGREQPPLSCSPMRV